MPNNDSVNLPGHWVPKWYETIGSEFFDDLDLELEPITDESEPIDREWDLSDYLEFGYGLDI
jgi:hypothetical protein